MNHSTGRLIPLPLYKNKNGLRVEKISILLTEIARCSRRFINLPRRTWHRICFYDSESESESRSVSRQSGYGFVECICECVSFGAYL